eukprot:m.33064 g.33064  ORF g.33064 m.33064 type:complete len:191 (-) comp9832_c0_seq3:332-904(-)
MAHGRGFTAIVYAIFVFLALILVAFSISLPTWILSDTSDGACGPFTYSNDRSNINDVALWDKLVKDNPVVFWLASSVCLLLAGVLLLAGFVFISFQACLPTKLLGLTRFLLLLCVVLEVASACLFASGLGNATVDASDDPINSVVSTRYVYGGNFIVVIVYQFWETNNLCLFYNYRSLHNLFYYFSCGCK